MKNGLVFLSLGVAGLLAGCQGGKDCPPHSGTFCNQDKVYWTDSCGNMEEPKEDCTCGCLADRSGCESCGCQAVCTGKCCGPDSCGQQCPDECAATSQTCNTSTCSCEGICQGKTCTQLGRECGRWDNGCGQSIDCPVCTGGKTCDATGHCTGGSTVCPGGRTLCGLECVDTKADPQNCNSCFNACPSGQVCDQSTCKDWADCRQSPCPGLSYCDLGLGKCRPGCVSDSQCSKNEACNMTTRQCDCKAGYDRCEGQCSSTTSAADQPCSTGSYCDFTCHHCAQGCAFDSQCGANQYCQNHACACIANYHACTGGCVASNSIDHCGSSCSSCLGPAHATNTCDGSHCGYQCFSGYHDCGGSCVLNTNPQNCGTKCSACIPPDHATTTCDGTNCGYSCNSGYVPCDTQCCENCSTAGCTGSTWCDDTTGLCQPGCTTHDQCQDGYFCCLDQHACVLTVDDSCPSGYTYLGMCSDDHDFCVHGCLPSGTTCPFVDPCPAGTTERGDWYCSDVTRICVPDN